MTSKKKAKNNNNNSLVLGIISAVFIIVIIIIVLVTPQENVEGVDYTKYAQVINNRLNLILDRQEAIDKELKKVLEDDKYTINNPYVKINPYEISPLSALIMFKTPDVTSVKIYINEEFFATVEASRNHIIPIYALYNNVRNMVRLELEDGTKKEIELVTTSLNDNIQNIDTNYIRKNYNDFFIIGSLNHGESSVLRGFDKYGSLINYINLNYITGYKLRHEHFFVQYNQKNTYGTDLPNLKLEMDYLGKIYDVSEDTSELTTEPNIDVNDVKYIGYGDNIYKSTMDNYEFKQVILENNVIMKPSRTYTNMLEESLNDAKDYTGKLTIIPNGNTITIATDKQNVKAILVEVDGSESYVFLVDNNTIRTNLRGKYVVFLQIDSITYTTDIIVNM